VEDPGVVERRVPEATIRQRLGLGLAIARGVSSRQRGWLVGAALLIVVMLISLVALARPQTTTYHIGRDSGSCTPQPIFEAAGYNWTAYDQPDFSQGELRVHFGWFHSMQPVGEVISNDGTRFEAKRFPKHHGKTFISTSCNVQ
jgi:hypothetical protein